MSGSTFHDELDELIPSLEHQPLLSSESTQGWDSEKHGCCTVTVSSQKPTLHCTSIKQY